MMNPHQRKDIQRKMEEVAGLVESVASGEGLRAAQKRALEKARRLLRNAVDEILTSKSEHNQSCQRKVRDAVAKISELLCAYFYKSNGS